MTTWKLWDQVTKDITGFLLANVQGIWVRSLVHEDPTCCRGTMPVGHNYWACTLEPVSCNYWASATTEAYTPRVWAPVQEKPPQWEAGVPQRRVTPSCHSWRRPSCSNEEPVQTKKQRHCSFYHAHSRESQSSYEDTRAVHGEAHMEDNWGLQPTASTNLPAHVSMCTSLETDQAFRWLAVPANILT